MANSSSDMSPYAFKTLWHEITAGIGYAFSGIVDMVGLKEAGWTNRLMIWKENETTQQNNTHKAAKNNSIVLVVVFAVVLILLLKKS